MPSQSKQAARETCHRCKGTGIVYLWRRDAYGPHAFHPAAVCTCALRALEAHEKEQGQKDGTVTEIGNG